MENQSFDTVAVASTPTRSPSPDAPSPEARAAAGERDRPLVWVLAGHRAGDRVQMIALAEALGWPFRTKQLAYRSWHRLPNLLIGPSVMSVDLSRSDPLDPPWPDLVISAGKRSVPAALWIRAQSQGQTRLVHIGRPWAPLGLFDLIVTAPQYGLPERPNVLRCTMPLHGITAGTLAGAAGRWAPRLENLPRPFIVLLLGGNSASYRLSAEAASRLGAAADELAAQAQGSVLVTSSSRTPPAALAAVEARLTRPAYIHRWRARDPENPYIAFLGLADSLIVTGDSASLLSEACCTGRPVRIFDLPRRLPFRPRRPGRFAMRLAELGIVTPERDMSRLHAALIERGLAARLGEPPPAGGHPPDELHHVVERVRGLMEHTR